MSAFKYACPVCGQHIECDVSQTGTVMECPTCFQKITVPQAPAAENPKFIMKGTKVGERPTATAFAASGTVVAPVKRFPSALLGMILLLCVAGAGLLLFREALFHSNPAGTDAATNRVVAGAASNLAASNTAARVLGYRLGNGEVVFVFEPAAFGVQVASNALVHVAGDFNQWLGASDGSIRNRFELRRNLADFQQRPQWEFKFVVDSARWIEPPGNALNRSAGKPVNLTLTIPEQPGGMPK
jgi:DNA-directed RNA polymerase subunit RPC12/RpoP